MASRSRGLVAMVVAVALLAGAGCRKRRARAAPPADAGVIVRIDAARSTSDDPAWRVLDGLPQARPRWHVALSPDPLAPAIDVHGPLVIDGIAVVAGSAIGTAGVDLARGVLRFERPPAGRIARPAGLGGDQLLSVGDCPYPLDVARGDVLVGCYVVLSVRDQAAYGAGSVVARGADAAALGAGATTVVVDGRTGYLGRAGGWLRFELADPPRGAVRATPVGRREVPPVPGEPRVSVGTGEARVELWALDDILELRYHDPLVMSDRSAVKNVAAAPGSLFAIDDATVRVFRLGDGAATVQPTLVDLATLVLDPLGEPVPGIQLLAAAHGERGFAIAVRLDASLQHDYVAAFGRDGRLAWVYPLPAPPGGGRAQPVGVAVTAELVVVFHDGTVVTALPGI